MKRMATALTCAAATAFALSPAAPAQAETVHAKTTDYTLEIFDAADDTGEYSHRGRWAALDCDPVGGDHPRAEEACDLIAEHGDIASVQGVSEGPCTMIYKPVTIRVTGIEEYEETFGNECVMKGAKGAVFDF